MSAPSRDDTFIPVQRYLQSLVPQNLIELPDISVFDAVWMQPPNLVTDPSVTVSAALLFETSLELGIPGLDAIKLVIAPDGNSTQFMLQFAQSPTPTLSVVDVPIALRFGPELLKPARKAAGGDGDSWEVDPAVSHVDITLAKVTLSGDADGNFSVKTDLSIDMPPAMIGDTGVVIEAQDIGIHLDANSPPPGKPVGWRGVHIGSASVHLPGGLSGTVGTLSMTDCYIGNGGFSGTVSDTWAPALTATIFGMTCTLKSAEITFVQNSLTAASLAGSLTLPFFDEPLDVAIGFGLNGAFTVALSDPSGVLTLTKPGVLAVEVHGLGFEATGGVATVHVSGKVTPLFGGLSWPALDIKDLAIDSGGHVHLAGGWLDLPSQYSLDFHGFSITITKLGFGKTDDGTGKWIGFSGGLKLVDGLSAGASVDGLRITWFDDGSPAKITLEGVGVEFETPDVLRFKGKVSYKEPSPGVHRFDGAIKLELLALDLEIDGTLVIGSAPGYTFFAIYLDAELPAGIPLWATGLGLYGMAGLFALNMAPGRQPDQPWYEIGSSTDWFHSPQTGVTDLATKWTNVDGALAVGAGITIGTEPDNGFTFSGKMLLVLSFPGPVLLIQGAANILKQRSILDDDPLFRALVVLDFNAGNFLVGLDMEYKYGDGGELIDIHGGCEAFFSTSDPSAWHLYLGIRDPREKRIRAHIIKLFEADSYFMLDAHQLAMGSLTGYDAHWDFGPLSVTLEAWIDGNVVVSWKPVHLHGDLWLHGKAGLSVFGFGVSLGVDARFAADVFDPFDVLAEFSVSIDLPWPLPDFGVDIKLEFGPTPTPPPIPMPVKEITVEHFKVSTSWPLPRTSAPALLVPDYDTNADGFLDAYPVDPAPATAALAAPPPSNSPVVPLDARPHITFGRAVHDLAPASVNPQPVTPDAERIGDPAKNQGPTQVRYSLAELDLHTWDGASWTLVARVAATPNPPGVKALYGSWAPMPSMPDGAGANPGQVKLWLWSKTPFDYTSHSGSSWDEWFTAKFPGYPCIPAPPYREYCCDFSDVPVGTTPSSPYSCGSGIKILWYPGTAQPIAELSKPVDGLSHELCIQRGEGRQGFTVAIESTQAPGFGIGAAAAVGWGGLLAEVIPPEPAAEIVIVLAGPAGPAWGVGLDANGNEYGPFGAISGVITITGDAMTAALIGAEKGGICLLQVCCVTGESAQQAAARQEMMQHMRDELALWSQTGEVLQPDTQYRLTVVTKIETSQNSIGPDSTVTELTYFRTEGPPGLAALSVPLNSKSPDSFSSGLDDLRAYVAQTVPATVPARGQKPALPKPVFRGYDVGVAFNEDYTDLMYRLAGRDLGVYLYDASNRPVRDARGALIVIQNRWGHADAITVTESGQLWINTVNTSTCASLDTTTIPYNNTLGTAGAVLDPDTVYEARLTPLLLHETFTEFPLNTTVTGPSGTLGRWYVVDEGTSLGPSAWTTKPGTPGAVVEQSTKVYGGTLDGTDPVKPGTLLLYGDDPALPGSDPAQPGNWTDYRITAILRSADDDGLGLVFRYQDENTYYRFSLDRQRSYRRLVAVTFGITTVLAEDDFTYQMNTDYVITIEAAGASISVYQDGVPVFQTTNAAIDHGRFGLYCWGDAGAQFADIRVDDFRARAPVPYRFSFTTSNFTSAFHHAHSYQDETWPLMLPTGTDLAAAVAAAVPAPSPTSGGPAPPGDAEARAFDALAGAAIGQTAVSPPPELQISRITEHGSDVALLVRSPEPVDWSRSTLSVSFAARTAPAPLVPGPAKLTDVTFGSGGSAQPNDESVSVLLRETLDLTGYRLERRAMPDPLEMPPGDLVLFADDFTGRIGGRLFTETFGPNALDHYTLIDSGNWFGPSHWFVAAGAIQQDRWIFGGSLGDDGNKPGSVAVTGSPDWDNVAITITLQSSTGYGIGLVFRFADAANHYRLSLDNWTGKLRLVRVSGGTPSVLWQEPYRFNNGQDYTFEVLTWQSRLLGYLDGTLLFDVTDTSIRAGQAGYYVWADAGAVFSAFSVDALESAPVLWAPAFTGLAEITVTDSADAVNGPSQWAAAGGVLTQTSDIYVPDAAAYLPGTYAAGGYATWADVTVSARLRTSSGGSMGIMFRYLDDNTYYRLAFDTGFGVAWLIKRVAGVVSLLWWTPFTFASDTDYDVSVTARSGNLSASANGGQLFRLWDAAIDAGKVALYCRQNPGASFTEVRVVDATVRAGAWTVHDQALAAAPSVWQRRPGMLAQRSSLGAGPLPDAPGTVAVAGNPAWTDYRLAVMLRSDGDQGTGVVFRYQTDHDYYRFSMNSAASYRRLVRCAAGTFTTLWEDAVAYPSGQDLEVVIDAIGSRFTGHLDGVLLFDITDDALPPGPVPAGAVGVYAWDNPAARFSRVSVSRPPLEAYALFADAFPSGDFSAFTIVDEGTLLGPSNWYVHNGALHEASEIYEPPIDRNTLAKRGTYALAGDTSWTDVILDVMLRSDDGSCLGVMARYTGAGSYYRFSMDSLRGYRRLVRNSGGTFTLLWEDAVAYTPGRSYRFTLSAIGAELRGYLDGVLTFAVVDSELPVGAIALYDWGEPTATFSHVRVYPGSRAFRDWLLREPFQLADLSGWTIVDEGTTGAPSAWAVDPSKGLTQTSSISGGDPSANDPAKPGTNAIAGDPTWDDYRLTVQLSSGTDRGIGAFVRYADRDNYYRFSMDAALGYRRLVRKHAGVVTSLWEDAVAYVPGREYVLTLDCSGDRLSGYLDGVLLFDVTDSALAAGVVGLYAWHNPGAVFREVLVAPVAWVSHYSFAGEVVASPGTRLQVFSGNASAAPAPTANVGYRFATALTDPGTVRFTGDSVDLRLLDATGQVVHSRRFLAPSGYGTVAATVLRRADGTGFFVFVPSGGTSVLPPGQYRLALTYNRDNRATVPDSQVLTQNGSAEPELATLDVPWLTVRPR